MKRLLPTIVAALLAACASAPPQPAAPPAKDALYKDLGGTAGIEAVVDGSLKRIHGDARINGLFKHSDIKDLRRLLVEQICAATGGPCTYTGRSMEEAHSGLNLTERDFTAFVQDLVGAMNDLKVPKANQDRLLALLAPMKPQVVGQ